MHKESSLEPPSNAISAWCSCVTQAYPHKRGDRAPKLHIHDGQWMGKSVKTFHESRFCLHQRHPVDLGTTGSSH